MECLFVIQREQSKVFDREEAEREQKVWDFDFVNEEDEAIELI